MLRHTEECRTRGYPVRRRPVAAAGLDGRATAIRPADRRRRLPVHQRVRGRPDRAEDRLVRRARSSTGWRSGCDHSGAKGARIERKGEPPLAGRVRPRGAQGRPHRRRRRLPGRLPGRAGLGAAAGALRPGRLACSRRYVIETVGTQEYELGQARLPRAVRRRLRPGRASPRSRRTCAACGPERGPIHLPRHVRRRSSRRRRAGPSARPRPRRRARSCRRRRRPRAGHPARGLPQRPASRCRCRGAARSAGGRRTRAGCSRSTGCGSAGRCGGPAGGSRSGSTRPTTRSCAAAPTRSGPAAGSARTSSPRLPPAARARAGRTASRRGRADARMAGPAWPAACTAWRSAGCSPGSRCSTGNGRLQGGAGRAGRDAAGRRPRRARTAARAAARRAVGHRAPGWRWGRWRSPGRTT